MSQTLLIKEEYEVNQSSKLNQKLTQAFGMFLGIAIAVWVLRGFGILTFVPGGVILLLFLAAIAFGILSYVQKIWWRF
ncbi:MAG: hypothetical protein ACFCUV_16630 [Rivularia sp. (in: cyanobacteria)]